MEYSCYRVNPSPDSINETAWSYLSQQDQNQYQVNGFLLAIVLGLFMLVGTTLNLLVVAIIFKKKFYKRPTFVLLLNMSMTDFLLCVLVMPFHVVNGFAGEFVFGNSDLIRCRVCKIGVVLPILISESLYSVSLLSIDRFIFIKLPFRYNKIVSFKTAVLAVFATWLISVSIGVPPLFSIGEINYSVALFHCTLDIHQQAIYTIILVFISAPPLLTVVIPTLWVACIAQKHLRAVYKTQVTLNSDQEYTEAIYRRIKKTRLQFHLVRAFGAIITGNMVTWLPMLGWICAAAAVDKLDVPLFFKSFAYIGFLLQPVLHPVLEASLISDIKVPLMKVLKSAISCWKCFHKENELIPLDAIEAKKPCDCGLMVNGVTMGKMGGVWTCSVCSVLDMCSVLVLPPAAENQNPA